MNRQSIHQQISTLLKTINDQHELIKSQKQSIPQVEIDFMMQTMRQLYEASLLLNHTNALASLDEVKASLAQKLLSEKRAADLSAAVVPPVYSAEVPEPALPIVTHISEKILIQADTVKATPTTKQTKKKSVELNTSFTEQPTVGDSFNSELSLHSHIASKSSSKRLGDTLSHKPISDLKTGIGLNEKFLFVNKLFNGNLKDYSDVIDTLNAMPDVEQALNYLEKELVNQYGWEQAGMPLKIFRGVITRRYARE